MVRAADYMPGSRPGSMAASGRAFGVRWKPGASGPAGAPRRSGAAVAVRVLDGFVDRLDYPMFIVTAAAAGTGGRVDRSGCLVGFATQCSIEPERLLVCLSKKNHTYQVARTAVALGVHVPGARQRELAELFGTT